jgi:N-acyl-D-aspartate/D-glutamate deacylase
LEKAENKTSIQRRQAVKQIVTTSLALGLVPSIVVGQSSNPFKIVIKNGKVYTQDALQEVFVGITHDNKIKVSAKPIEAETTIDATGKIVSPGFVDVLADNAGNPQSTYLIFEKYKITDGATSILQLHGGAANVAAFHKSFDSRPHYVNYGVGVFVMILRNQYASLPLRYKLVEQGLAEGGLAVCHSLEYQPTPYNEVVEYAKLAAKYDRPLFLHLRYSSQETELQGVEEAIKLSQETGAKVHIDHLHSTGGTYNMEKALDLIQNANNLGAKITTCVYPYSYWATYLISKRFDPGWQQRFKINYQDLTIVGTGEKLTAQTFAAYRNRAGLLVATPPGTMPFEKTIDLALQTDFCMIASDGGIESEPKANNHPRGAGCFSTAIRHAFDIGMSLEKILYKVSTLPARLIKGAMDDRGEIADDKIADITIFDPKTINGKASVTNPNQFSEGIDTVILNGQIVYQDKKLLKTAGKPIRFAMR